MTARTVVARVPSASTSGRRYAVRRFPTGLDCECPAFGFSRAKACSHTRLVKAAESATERCSHLAATASARTDDGRLGVKILIDIPQRGGKAICTQCLVDLLAAAARKVKRDYVPKATLASKLAAKRARKKEAKQRGNK